MDFRTGKRRSRHLVCVLCVIIIYIPTNFLPTDYKPTSDRLLSMIFI